MGVRGKGPFAGLGGLAGLGPRPSAGGGVRGGGVRDGRVPWGVWVVPEGVLKDLAGWGLRGGGMGVWGGAGEGGDDSTGG